MRWHRIKSQKAKSGIVPIVAKKRSKGQKETKNKKKNDDQKAELSGDIGGCSYKRGIDTDSEDDDDSPMINYRPLKKVKQEDDVKVEEGLEKKMEHGGVIGNGGGVWAMDELAIVKQENEQQQILPIKIENSGGQSQIGPLKTPFAADAQIKDSLDVKFGVMEETSQTAPTDCIQGDSKSWFTKLCNDEFA